MTFLLGLSGKAESGKTTVAQAIKDAAAVWGRTVEIFEISHEIYLHCVHAGLLSPGLKRSELTDAQVKVLVDEGSRMRDEVDPHYWSNIVVKRMTESNADIAICPNVRMPQEAEAIRTAGGIVVRVNRVNQDGTPFVSPTRDPLHKTETALDYWPADYYITSITDKIEWLVVQSKTIFLYLCDRRASERQKMPTTGAKSRVVIEFLRNRVPESIFAMLLERSEMGTKKYGSPLLSDNGRDCYLDGLQEALDGVMYGGQIILEGGPPDFFRSFVTTAVELQRYMHHRDRVAV